MLPVVENKLESRNRLGNKRQLLLKENLIDFSSNDYLGLAKSEILAQRILDEWETKLQMKNGSSGSRLLTGNTRYAQDLEKGIAAFHGYEAGLLFNCGYMANIGLLQAVSESEGVILYDRQVHASVHDGIRLSGMRAYSFRHNDIGHLEDRLKYNSGKDDLYICVESIYSTCGTKSPLIDICKLAQKYNARLIVDEAHSTGIYGHKGRGLVAEYNLTDQVFAQITTFGKAFGVHGAIVLSNGELNELLINFSRSFIYTTAMASYSLAAIKCSYDLIPHMDHERQHLRRLATYFNTHDAPIQPIICPGNTAVRRLSNRLEQLGFDVRPLTSPTVKPGEEMLRICLHSFNTERQVSDLIAHIKEPIT